MEANQTQTAAFANLSLSAETITELQTYLLAVANYYHIRPALKSGSRWAVFSEPVRKRENLLSRETPDSVRTKSNRAFQSGECDNNLRLPADMFVVR